MLVSLLVSPVFAWVPSGVSWDWQDHALEDPVYINYGSFPSDVGDPGETRDAVLGAMSSWNALGDDVGLTYAGSTTLAANDPDGTFVVFWADAYAGGGTLAYAGTWTWEDGVAYDCDIVFLDSNDYGQISWDSDPSGPASGRFDVRAVALHELGHCLGLDHSDRADAVMYAYYGGLRALSSDEADAMAAMYGDPCVDADGDGWTDCAADCDDGNALVHPTAAEVCDGADGDCDGVVDEQATQEIVLVDPAKSRSMDSAYGSVGNVIEVEAATLLVSAKVRMVTPAGSRLAWTVYSSATQNGTYTLERSEIAYATGDEWQASPPLNLPLVAGRYYNVSLGSFGASQTFWYQGAPSRKTLGPITPVGYSAARATGDNATRPAADFLVEQTLEVVGLADADGDGTTAMCGDCDDTNADLLEYVGPETCDGTDEDCDGEIDEDFASDVDSDGTFDCLDPCPEDPQDDADGDGACDGVDPCPEDAADSCLVADDTDPADTGAEAPTTPGCGCASSSSGMAGWTLALAALVVARRRR